MSSERWRKVLCSPGARYRFDRLENLDFKKLRLLLDIGLLSERGAARAEAFRKMAEARGLEAKYITGGEGAYYVSEELVGAINHA